MDVSEVGFGKDFGDSDISLDSNQMAGEGGAELVLVCAAAESKAVETAVAVVA